MNNAWLANKANEKRRRLVWWGIRWLEENAVCLQDIFFYNYHLKKNITHSETSRYMCCFNGRVLIGLDHILKTHNPLSLSDPKTTIWTQMPYFISHQRLDRKISWHWKSRAGVVWNRNSLLASPVPHRSIDHAYYYTLGDVVPQRGKDLQSTKTRAVKVELRLVGFPHSWDRIKFDGFGEKYSYMRLGGLGSWRLSFGVIADLHRYSRGLLRVCSRNFFCPFSRSSRQKKKKHITSCSKNFPQIKIKITLK